MPETIVNLLSRFDTSRYKTVVLISFAFFFVCLRTLLEVTSAGLVDRGDLLLSLFVSIQYILWFISTFLMILVCFRYIAKTPVAHLPYLLLSSVVLLIPIFSVLLLGEHAQFVFLSYKDPGLFKSILSLMYFSPTNHHMFYEALLLVVGVPSVAYFFCRDVVRSVMTMFCVYGFLIFIQAFLYVCSVEMCVFVAKSDIPISIFLCFYTIVLAAGWLAVLLLPELRRYLSSEDTIFTQANVVWALLCFVPYAAVSMLMSTYLIDLLFMFASYFIFFYTLLFLFAHAGDRELRGLNTYLGIFAALVFSTFALTVYQFFFS